MDTTWEQEWRGPKPDQFIFWVEFYWDGIHDRDARDQFQRIHKDLFTGCEPITAANTIGYYITGTRTFWMIGCADKWEQVTHLCKRVVGGSISPMLKYNAYKCNRLPVS
jgi:hypothetical protein